eukprot:scaffold26.g3360.t1
MERLGVQEAFSMMQVFPARAAFLQATERIASSTACSTSGRQLAASAAAGWRETGPGGAAVGLWGGLLQRRHASSNLSDVGLKFYKPTTPGFRGRVITSRKDLWKGGPFKPLTEGLGRSGGRNTRGVVTTRHRGGGSKRLYRLVDFKRPPGAAGPGTVQRIEYDPNRSTRIALLQHAPDRHSYVLAPQGLAPGDVVHSGTDVPIRPGNTLPLANIPVGMQIHNVELRPGAGGQLARAAGTSCTLVKKGDDGKLGKAGAARWLGRRPTVRGVAMNPVDHPHGGGRGKSKGRISQTPWGKPTKGYRTRHNPRTDWAIRVSRHKAKRANA